LKNIFDRYLKSATRAILHIFFDKPSDDARFVFRCREDKTCDFSSSVTVSIYNNVDKN